MSKTLAKGAFRHLGNTLSQARHRVYFGSLWLAWGYICQNRERSSKITSYIFSYYFANKCSITKKVVPDFQHEEKYSL